MATPNKPVIGNLYSPREQYEMHGGNMQRCAPDKDGIGASGGGRTYTWTSTTTRRKQRSWRQ
jgi:hypothetical protein